VPCKVLALNATTFCQLDHALALPAAREAGLCAVELSAGRGKRALIKPDFSRSEISGWKAKLQSYGLHALALCAHRNLGDREERAAFESLLEKADALGCRLIITAVPDGCDDQAYRDGLALACRKAERLGLQVALETHGIQHGCGCSLLPFMEVSGQLSICYDTGNVLFYGGVSPLADLPQCIHRVGHLHLKDKAGALQEWNFPPLGQGEVDFAALFHLSGWKKDLTASIEVEFTPAGVSEEETRRAIMESVQFLQKFR